MVLIVIAALVLLAAGIVLVVRGLTPAEAGGTNETIAQIETSYGFAAAPKGAQPFHQSALTTILTKPTNR